MNKKFILSALSLMLAISMQAQVTDTESADSTETTSLDDIIKQQSGVQSSRFDIEHDTKVWKHNGYFNMAYNTAKMTAETLPLYTNNYSTTKDVEFKSDWGVSLVWGEGYRLHKKPIANIVGINLDYTWMDLNVNHFKSEDSPLLYNSTDKYTSGSDSYHYMPYALEKYQASYGMNIGPSVTIAPFTPIGVKELDYLKIQAYFHVGYRISAIYMVNDEEKDANPNTSRTSSNTDYNDMRNNLKLSLGTNVYTSFGINLSWHAIGIGYEHSSGKIKYKPTDKDTFGSEKIEMEHKTNKVYINFRF